MRPIDSNKVLSERLSTLLASSEGPRLDLAKRMNVSDGTLGRIKYGQGNPTLEVVDRIAAFYRVEPWQLIKPDDGMGATDKHRIREEVTTYAQSSHPLLSDDENMLLADYRACTKRARVALRELAHASRSRD